VPVAAVPTLDEILADPALHRGAIHEAEHPVVGAYRSIGPPIRFDDSPMSVRRPAPLVGQDTVEVLRELGFDDDDVAALLASRAARQSEH
jgi:crotonobetainyl-CoA:carnitine CoA-transferase CaiB-like acyl-CoA transferase